MNVVIRPVIFILLLSGFLLCDNLIIGQQLKKNNAGIDRAAGSGRHKILVLPPYDLIANEGISPNIQQYLETAIAKDTSVMLIKFPYKKLMGVRYQNVFDKKYCTPILAKLKTDIIIMSKLQMVNPTGNMVTDTWNCSIRVYNTVTGKQFNSKLSFTALTSNQIEAKIAAAYAILGDEIK